MRLRKNLVNTIKSCDTKEKGGMVAIQVSKKRKLNGRGYREWMKSLLTDNGSGPSIQKERLLSQIGANTTEPKDSSDNGSSDSSQSPSKPVRLNLQLRRIRDSYNAKRRYSPSPVNQTEVQGNSILRKFKHPTGEENKSTTTEFVEYWVPVRLSNLQTEQYCGSLFSNSTVLCSSYSYDPMKLIHEILFSTKKCCDHPYLVDWSLHTSLIKGIQQSEQLDEQIKLSSKLLLLHKALVEIKKRGLRVLILYQPLGGSGPITTGDILDDIIHEKFGEDSFVRIDGNPSRSKRRAEVKSFNEKKGGKFVCLMETRACIPSIRLKSIDTVIFFNSDWDPTNDLKALQKLSLDSQFEQVKVFRLYSAHTVEEKALMLTKNGITLEGCLRNMKRSTCRELLAWGAYFLFQKLDDFHAISTTETGPTDSNGDSFAEEVFQELSVLLPNSDKGDVHSKSSLIAEVQQVECVYSTNMSLVGEAEYPLMDNYSVIEEMLVKEPPYVFWINILEGRTPSWKYFSCESPKSRKSAQSLDALPDEYGRPSKKRRTEAGTTACQTPTVARRRRRRRRISGEVAAASRMKTPTLDKPPSLELPSQLPFDDHDQLPSPTEAQNEHHLGSSSEYFTRGSLPGNTQRGSNTAEDARAREVLGTVSKVLQREIERLENQKTECSKQHEDMKQQTRMAYEKEVDEIHKKYEAILQNAHTAFLKEQELLDARYNKVRVNKALAEAMVEKDSDAAVSVSQAAIKFSVEQAVRLISQPPISSVDVRTERAAVASTDLHSASRVEGGGCLRAPPHLLTMMQVKHSPPPALPKLPSERPMITFLPVSLEQMEPSPFPFLLPPA